MTRCLVRAIAVTLVLGGLAAIAAPAGAERQLPRSQQEIQLSFAPLVKRAALAVVNIFTTKTVGERAELRLWRGGRSRSAKPRFESVSQLKRMLLRPVDR